MALTRRRWYKVRRDAPSGDGGRLGFNSIRRIDDGRTMMLLQGDPSIRLMLIPNWVNTRQEKKKKKGYSREMKLTLIDLHNWCRCKVIN